MKDGELYGKKIYQLTYLPSQVGQSQIKPLEITWFNTQTRKMEVLKIPGVPFEVFKARNNAAKSSGPSSIDNKNGFAMWMVLLLGFLIGGTLMWFLRAVSWELLLENLKNFEFKNFNLKRACFKNQAPQVRIALLKWARQQDFALPIRDLHDICRQIPDGEFKLEIKNLIACLFSSRAGKTWNGQHLWRAFKQFKLIKFKDFDMDSQQQSLNP